MEKIFPTKESVTKMSDNKEPIHITLEQRQEDVRRSMIERLVAYRKNLGISQQAIADALGVSRPNIGRFEKPDYNPTIDMIVKVADQLGLDVEINFIKREDK